MYFFFDDNGPYNMDFPEEKQESGEKFSESLFESIRHVNEYGQEFWYARELQIALEYKQWRRFSNVIDKAKEACLNSGNNVLEHFADVGKTSPMPNGGEKEIGDIELSRYACYLIVQNGDPRKKAIELIEHYDELTEDQKRLAIRKEMTEHNKQLVAAAKDAGVKTTLEYASFQNHGYMGLYGGLTAKDIHERKGLKKSQKILDHMGYEELAANLFRATRENIQGKAQANQTHYDVGKEVRSTIERLGGTMPEDLPTPEKSIKQIEREQRKELKSKKKD